MLSSDFGSIFNVRNSFGRVGGTLGRTWARLGAFVRVRVSLLSNMVQFWVPENQTSSTCNEPKAIFTHTKKLNTPADNPRRGLSAGVLHVAVQAVYDKHTSLKLLVLFAEDKAVSVWRAAESRPHRVTSERSFGRRGGDSQKTLSSSDAALTPTSLSGQL